MIGQLVRLYCEGRRDAQHGKKRPRLNESSKNRIPYLLGWHDERRRMHLDRRLVQYEMDLEPGGGDAVGPETLPGELD